MGVEEKLKALGLSLPEAPRPVAAYIPAVKIDNMVYTAGQLAFVKGELQYKGRLGKDLTVEEGYESARICALNALAAVKGVAGSLDNIERIVRVTGYVNSTGDFTDQPRVLNGASELLKELFGEAGLHARSAIGVNALPLGASVEVELIVLLC
jgi:enamine deaminase RidA (YjgF/YER057c/UK114 family)